jgi:hypothetical protein
MNDKILEMFFEPQRWEYAIEKGVGKDINRAYLYQLTKEETRAQIYQLMKAGKYDNELAIKAWQYLADDGVRAYDREFGSGKGSLTLLPKNTRVAIAKQLRDYYLEDVEGIANGDYDFY